MSKTYDQLRLQDEYGCRLRKALHSLQHKLGGAPNVAGQLTRCRELFGSKRAWDDQDLLPSPIPTRSRCDSDKLIAIVLHEVKLAIIRWWELIRTGQTTGLDELIGNLEEYAEHGLDGCEVLGSPEDGYHIFNKAALQKYTINIPEPPALTPLSVEGVLDDCKCGPDPANHPELHSGRAAETEDEHLAHDFLDDSSEDE